MIRWMDGADDNLELNGFIRDYNVLTEDNLTFGQPGFAGGKAYKQSGTGGANFVTPNLNEGIATADVADEWAIGFRLRLDRNTNISIPIDPLRPLLAVSEGSGGSPRRIRAACIKHEGEKGFRIYFYWGLQNTLEEFVLGFSEELSFETWHYVEAKFLYGAEGLFVLRINGHEHTRKSASMTSSAGKSLFNYWGFELASNNQGSQFLTDIYISDNKPQNSNSVSGSGILSKHAEGMIVRSSVPTADAEPQEWLPSARVVNGTSVILAFGQSNMDGVANLDTADARFSGPQNGRLIWNPFLNSNVGGWETLDADTLNNKSRYFPNLRQPGQVAKMCPMLSFMEKLYEHEGQEVRLVKCAKGSTWMFGWQDPGFNTNSWTYFNGAVFGIDLFFTMISDLSLALNAMSSPKDLKAILLIQGESDALWLGTPGQLFPQPELPSRTWLFFFKALYSRLQGFIKLYFNDTSLPDIPVIIGRTHAELPNTGQELSSYYWTDRIREAQEAAAADPQMNVTLVDLDGLTSVDNGTHFDAASLETIGQRFFDAYLTTQPHYDRVDDFANPDDGTYVESGEVGAREVYSCTAMSNPLYALRGFQFVADGLSTSASPGEVRMLLGNQPYSERLFGQERRQLFVADNGVVFDSPTVQRRRSTIITSPDIWPYSFDPGLFSQALKGFKLWSYSGATSTLGDDEQSFSPEATAPVTP